EVTDDSIWSPTMNGLPDGDYRIMPHAVAADYLSRLRRAGQLKWATAQGRINKFSEEAGEVVKVWNRLHGFARSTDTPEHLAEELADTVICAYALALVEGIDLDEAIQKKHTVLMRREIRGEKASS